LSAALLGLISFAIVSQAQPANAQTATATSSQESSQSAPAVLKPVVMKPAARKPVAPKLASASSTSIEVPAAATNSDTPPAAAKPRRSSSSSAAKGPYYVDFRSRTAASYGHAFVWFGKSTDKKVDVAGLHPAGDEVPFILGHVIPVPAETGASYGDLDPQYLTANYKVYMSEADAKRVFAYIRKLQATTKFWNEATSSCTTFMGQIATFMGLKTPFYMQKPEEYVNQLRDINNNKQFIQLPSEVSSLEQ
jgi:hypothetical protein